MAKRDKNNDQNKPIQKFAFFGGIFFCIFAVCMVINIGVVCKVFTVIPNFLFGTCAFLIYALVYVFGIFLLFKEKVTKIKLNHIFLGCFFVFLASLIVLSLINNKVDASEQTYIAFFKNMYTGNGEEAKFGYFQRAQISPLNSLFGSNGINYSTSGVASSDPNNDPTYLFGGGYIGNLLANILISKAKLGLGGAWAISIVILLIGLIIAFKNKIKNLINKYIKKKPSDKPKTNNDYQIKNETNNVQPTQTFTPRPQPQLNLGVVANPYERVGNFAPARFSRTVEQENKPVEQETPIYNQPQYQQANFYQQPINQVQQNQYVQPEIHQEINQFNPTVQKSGQANQYNAPSVNAPVETRVEEHHEQCDIFQASEPVVHNDVYGAKPEWEERKEIENKETQTDMSKRVIMNQPMVQQEQPVEQVKVKKPIKWIPPSSDMLQEYETSEALEKNTKTAEERQVIIDGLFTDFGIGAHVESFTIGPSVTRFNIKCDANVSVNAIQKVVQDISVRLNGSLVRFTPIVEGQQTSGLEVPNAMVTTVSFKEVFEQLPDVEKTPLAVPFGKNIKGEVVSANYAEFPHLLVAGTTGSGKSIYVHSIIASLIMRNSPDKFKIVIIDPKGSEMGVYRDIPHLLTPIINDANKAKMILSKLCDEMNDRYRLFEGADFASDLKAYNEYARKHGLEEKPYIVAIVDEYADLVENCKEIGTPVVSIGQKARAAGIHLLIATQRPSTNIVTGTIKANMPTHVALTASSAVDSQTIIGEGGAEKLLGKGDMLVQSPIVSKNGAVRLQGCFVSKQELSRVCNYLKNNYETIYEERFLNLEEVSQNAGKAAAMAGQIGPADDADEAKYQSIKEWVMGLQMVSMSRIQGECGVGFNRARRIFTRLVSEGVVAPEGTSKGNAVLMRDPHTEIDTNSIPVSDDISHIG